MRALRHRLATAALASAPVLYLVLETAAGRYRPG